MAPQDCNEARWSSPFSGAQTLDDAGKFDTPQMMVSPAASVRKQVDRTATKEAPVRRPVKEVSPTATTVADAGVDGIVGTVSSHATSVNNQRTARKHRDGVQHQNGLQLAMRALLNRVNNNNNSNSNNHRVDPSFVAQADLMQHMHEQIKQLQEANARLCRDMEAVRTQIVGFEKREVSERVAISNRLDVVEKIVSGEGPVKNDKENNGIIAATGNVLTGAFARAASVYCEGPLLEAVQEARIFPDSKTFVDMPMMDDPEVILKAFAQLQPTEVKDATVLRKFIEKWFGQPGDDFEQWQIPDLSLQPPQLMKIRNPEMREWALAINKVWPTLGIKHKQEVHDFQQRHSALPRTNGMIVPGGRFREMYYWDTYWVVRGLMVCDMHDTARGIVEDLAKMVLEIGFIPNGGRIYYLDRSQPPMLTAMVNEIYKVTHDKQWLAEMLPSLEREYSFWMSSQGGRRVEMPRLGGCRERQYLNIYRSMRDTPRPESYVEDVDTAKEAQGLGRAPADVYRALASGAESGWDFTTRWLEDSTGRVEQGIANLATIDTCHVIPVCLNSILYHMEKTLAFFHRELHREESEAAVTKYDTAAKQRAITMNSWLWVGTSYRDYRLDVGAHSTVVALSDYAVPLWAGLIGPESFNAAVLVNSLKRSGLLALCGATTTTVDSGGRTQWDAPNAWPPLNLMLVEGLDQIPGTEALADCLCETWLRNNFITWQRTGYMHEKYDSFEPGRFGAGGEYEPQIGFGWTNGTALALLVREPRVKHGEPVHEQAVHSPMMSPAGNLPQVPSSGIMRSPSSSQFQQQRMRRQVSY